MASPNPAIIKNETASPPATANALLSEVEGTVLGHRDLRPQLAPPAGLDVVDTLAEVRASQQRPDTGLVLHPVWSPSWLLDPVEDPDGPCRRAGHGFGGDAGP